MFKDFKAFNMMKWGKNWLEIIESPKRDPEKIIIKLVNEAQQSLWMSTSLHSEFYNRPMVKAALQGAFKRVEEARLLLDSKVTDFEKTKMDFPWIFEDSEVMSKLNVRLSKERLLHWLVVDGRHFRLEKPHNGTVETSNMEIWDADKPTRDLLKRRFLTWWNCAGSPF